MNYTVIDRRSSKESCIIPFFDLKVLGREEALELCEQEVNKWCVVSIWSNPLSDREDQFKTFNFPNAKKVSQYDFHDITEKSKYLNARLCTKKDVKDILKFANECVGESLLIHCAAGVSRSTAIAFLIVLNSIKDKCKNPAEAALETVYKVRPVMYPNLHIMEIGVDLIARSKEEQIAWFREIYNSYTWKKIRG